MISVEIPQDILKRESKVLGNFSARQLICLGIAAALGGATFAGLRNTGVPTIVLRIVVVLVALVPLIFGFAKIYDEPVEKMLPIIIQDNLLLPAVRYYKSEGIIDMEELGQEVKKEGIRRLTKEKKYQPSKRKPGKPAAPSHKVRAIK